MRKSSRQTLLLGGLPGVGKSTLAANLVRENGAISISTDQVRNELTENSPKFTTAEALTAYSICEERVESYSTSDLGLLVVDTTSLVKLDVKNKLPEVAERTARRYGRDLIKLALIASHERILKRNRARAYSPETGTYNDDYHQSLIRSVRTFSHNMPGGSNWLFLDTDRMSDTEVLQATQGLLSGEKDSRISIASILPQIDFDTFHPDVMNMWVKDPHIPIDAGLLGRWSRYFDNRGVWNTYGYALSPPQDGCLARLFGSISGSLKDDNPFTPEDGTLLNNVTAFCERVVRRERLDNVIYLSDQPKVCREAASHARGVYVQQFIYLFSDEESGAFEIFYEDGERGVRLYKVSVAYG